MKAVLRTQDARGTGDQLSWLVPCDQRSPLSERALGAETSHAATSTSDCAASAMSRVETARAKDRHSRAVYDSTGVLL
jgi:hypothetical protein